MLSAILALENEVLVDDGIILSQVTVPYDEAKIGSAVEFNYNGVKWCGRVMDIRGNRLYCACLGYPKMFVITKEWIVS